MPTLSFIFSQYRAIVDPLTIAVLAISTLYMICRYIFVNKTSYRKTNTKDIKKVEYIKDTGSSEDTKYSENEYSDDEYSEDESFDDEFLEKTDESTRSITTKLIPSGFRFYSHECHNISNLKKQYNQIVQRLETLLDDDYFHHVEKKKVYAELKQILHLIEMNGVDIDNLRQVEGMFTISLQSNYCEHGLDRLLIHIDPENNTYNVVDRCSLCRDHEHSVCYEDLSHESHVGDY